MACKLSLLSYLILTSAVLLTFPDHSSHSTTTTPFSLSSPPSSSPQSPPSRQIKNPQPQPQPQPSPSRNPPSRQIKRPQPLSSLPRSSSSGHIKHPRPTPSLLQSPPSPQMKRPHPHPSPPQSPSLRRIEHSHPHPLPLRSPPPLQIAHPHPVLPSLPHSPPPRQIEHPSPQPSPPSPQPSPSAPQSLPLRPAAHPQPSFPQSLPSPQTELPLPQPSPLQIPPSPDTENSQLQQQPTNSTPPALPRTDADQEMAAIIEALIGAGDFGSWAGLLMAAATNQFPFPMLATFFVPDDVGLSDSDKPKSHPSIVSGLDFDPFLIPYHIVPQRLTFSDLQRCAIHSRLPTLFPDHSVLITNNSASNFTVDGSLVTHPDLYQNAAVVMHGVNAVFDYSRFGMQGLMPPPPPSPPKPRPHAHQVPRKPPFRPPVDVITPDTWQKETSSSGGKRPGLKKLIRVAVVSCIIVVMQAL